MGSDTSEFALAHVEKLLDRRQSTTTFYLSVNTATIAVIGLLLKNTQLGVKWLTFSVLLLLCSGFAACWIWRSLLRQYEILLEWWYARLRELEALKPDSMQLVTREYEDLYVAAKSLRPTRRIGMTKRELALNWVFTALYVIFAAGIALSVLF